LARILHDHATNLGSGTFIRTPAEFLSSNSDHSFIKNHAKNQATTLGARTFIRTPAELPWFSSSPTAWKPSAWITTDHVTNLGALQTSDESLFQVSGNPVQQSSVTVNNRPPAPHRTQDHAPHTKRSDPSRYPAHGIHHSVRYPIH